MIPCHDAFRGLPLLCETSAFVEPGGVPAWEIRHDPVTASVVVRYTAELFVDRRQIDHLTSALQAQLHTLAIKVHGAP